MNCKLRYSAMSVFALIMVTAVVLLAGTVLPAQAQTETVLYSFTGTPASGPDGAYPVSGPTLVGAWLVGTASEGGSNANGIAWAVNTTTGKEIILHTFQAGTNDGWDPEGGLAYYKGSLYGTTAGGSGRIFKISESGTKFVETILYSFSGPDGSVPACVTPVFDSAGNLYGTTAGGGSPGNGTVFELSAAGKLTTLHNFACSTSDGCIPQSGVFLDSKGNLYGTTQLGGTYGQGTLYEITAGGTYSILYNFTGGNDGRYPWSPPVLKGQYLYGTTQSEGTGGYGTVYEFNLKTSQITTLHSFAGGQSDGSSPFDGALVFDKADNLYGTTQGGGTYTCGTIYELAANGTFSILHSFACQPDGDSPDGNVVFDSAGNLYTTTYAGGAYTDGAVIKLTP